MPHAPVRRADVHAQIFQEKCPRIRDGLEPLKLALARRDLIEQLLLRRFLRLDDLREVLDEVVVGDGVERDVELVGLVAAGGLAHWCWLRVVARSPRPQSCGSAVALAACRCRSGSLLYAGRMRARR